jgi:hypothetical protein
LKELRVWVSNARLRRRLIIGTFLEIAVKALDKAYEGNSSGACIE